MIFKLLKINIMFTTYCHANSCTSFLSEEDQSGWTCPVCGNMSLVSKPTKHRFYTHAGLFHTDEVTAYAIALLADLVHQGGEGLIRLTDVGHLPSDGIIADIGREYEAKEMKFDHHQGFLTRTDGFPYATAGLMWKHFGEDVVQRIISSDFIEQITQRVDDILIKGIDAHDADNAYSANSFCSAGQVRLCTISNAISYMNHSDVSNHGVQKARFLEAANFVTRVLIGQIQQAKKFIEAKHMFFEVAEIKLEGRLIVLSENMPWREIVHEQNSQALFVISPSNHPGSRFSLTAVSVTPESRELKKPIERPDWFTGFIHQGKWIAGGESIEQLENLALENI